MRMWTYSHDNMRNISVISLSLLSLIVWEKFSVCPGQDNAHHWFPYIATHTATNLLAKRYQGTHVTTAQHLSPRGWIAWWLKHLTNNLRLSHIIIALQSLTYVSNGKLWQFLSNGKRRHTWNVFYLRCGTAFWKYVPCVDNVTALLTGA